MKWYYESKNKDPFDFIPITYHISSLSDPALRLFERFFRARPQLEAEPDLNIWIVKPGENSNRGQGISLYANLFDIKRRIKNLLSDGHTIIL
jgi:tubulin--tyrosine ligase